MSKKSRFRRCFDRNMVNVAKHCWNPSQYLHHIHWSLTRILCSKKGLLLTRKILRLLVNTLIADEKYPVFNGDNLKIPIKMQLSYKQKNFSGIFAILLTSRLKFKRFEKKDDPRNFFISNIKSSENVVR